MKVTTYGSMLFMLLASSCVSVGSGQVGVLWKSSSGTQPYLYLEGRHPISSWSKMTVYDARSLTRDEPFAAQAKNGLGVKMATTVRFHIVMTDAVRIQQEIGPLYYEKIILPLLGSEGRRVFSKYTPEEIYSTKRENIESELSSALRDKLADRHIIFEGFQIRGVELPATLQAAIEQMAVAEQRIHAMKYEVAGARIAAEQKAIEAQAEADHNRILQPSLTREIMEYERLQQLTKVATSVNAKDVVLSSGGPAPAPVVVTGTK